MEVYATYLPDSWLTVFDVPTGLRWQAGAPAGLALQDISTSDIEGALETPDDDLTLSFQYTAPDNQPRDAQPFTFASGLGGGSAVFDCTLEMPEFGLTGKWYIFYRFDDGSPWQASRLDFGDGTRHVERAGYTMLAATDPVCHDDYPVRGNQAFDAARSHLRVSVGPIISYYKYDPASPHRLEKVVDRGNNDYDSVLQKENPPGSVCY